VAPKISIHRQRLNVTGEQSPTSPFEALPSQVAYYRQIIPNKGSLPNGVIFQRLTIGVVESEKILDSNLHLIYI
jgi:hypothetical protein